jgi:hypothetical protein
MGAPSRRPCKQGALTRLRLPPRRNSLILQDMILLNLAENQAEGLRDLEGE